MAPTSSASMSYALTPLVLVTIESLGLAAVVWAWRATRVGSSAQ